MNRLKKALLRIWDLLHDAKTAVSDWFWRVFDFFYSRCTTPPQVADVEETIRHFDGTASQVEGVAIVFLVEDDQLIHILEETIGSLKAAE